MGAINTERAALPVFGKQLRAASSQRLRVFQVLELIEQRGGKSSCRVVFQNTAIPRYRKDYHTLHELDKYSHLDVFMGKNAGRDVFPRMLDELNA